MKDRLKRAHGKWVAGDEFWDRDVDLALLMEDLSEGAHLLVSAQRRMGKTSLLREAARRMQPEYLCLVVDLEKCADAPDAIVALSLAMQPHNSLWGGIRKAFSNFLAGLSETVEELNLGELGLKLRSGLNQGNWRDKGDDVLKVLAASEKPVVLFLDEVPILVNRLLKGSDFRMTPERRERTDMFLSWLRDGSLVHQDRIRFVLTGSVGLEPILRQAGLSATVNHFSPFTLPPWDEPTAIGCLEALGKEYGVEYEPGVPELVFERLGYGIPHHVQVFFNHLYRMCKRRNSMKVTSDDVAHVYETDMLSTRGHAELVHYEERLKLVLGEEVYPLALEVLTELAVVGELTAAQLSAFERFFTFESRSFADALKEILAVFEHDGYLGQRDGRYLFHSALLRDWWRARHAMGYQPVLQRLP